MFIVVHVAGSGNNYRPDHPPSFHEFRKRNTVNLAFLKENVAEAVQSNVAGVAVVINANPGFEKPETRNVKDFLAGMRGLLAKYPKPVGCIHGDSHYYHIDKPFRDEAGSMYMHFTRMEVFDSPNVAGVVVSVDPADPQVFSCRP